MIGAVAVEYAATQAHAVGDLYGHPGYSMGNIVIVANVKRSMAVNTVTTLATVSSKVQSRMIIPLRKSTMANSSIAGIEETMRMVTLFHIFQSSERI